MHAGPEGRQHAFRDKPVFFFLFSECFLRGDGHAKSESLRSGHVGGSITACGVALTS